jgi:uncharacterized repeat protein (TIGR03803 family)
MKTRYLLNFANAVVVAATLGWSVSAQQFTLLRGFTNAPDGQNPVAGVILGGNTLYGTTLNGGTNNNGTIFKVNTDGSGYATLYRFTNSSDGSLPEAPLILAGSTLYGTTYNGGTNTADYGAGGTIFKIETNGTGYQVIFRFYAAAYTSLLGAQPLAGLLLSGDTLYGTTTSGAFGVNGSGGTATGGTVFSIKTNGSGYATLHAFTNNYVLSGSNDVAQPRAGQLLLVGGTLYGTTYDGGTNHLGSLFKLNTDGSGYSLLFSFPSDSSGVTGYNPGGGLVFSNGKFYGTCVNGGAFGGGSGTVYSIDINGLGINVLHAFGDVADGFNPRCDLILNGQTLYGTTFYGGTNNSDFGTIFSVNTDGSGYQILKSFLSVGGSTNVDGANPAAGLVLGNNAVFGTSENEGPKNRGTVFSLTLAPVTSPPTLTAIILSNKPAILWPVSASGFTLQATTNLAPASWNTFSNGIPLATNSNNLQLIGVLVTNPFNPNASYFRLKQ